jgi:hypothetical protein
LEGGKIFADPLARTILGKEAHTIIEEEAADPSRRPMRLFIVARSRFAEDCLSAAVSRGVRQAVILGAGLDTFSLRNPHARLDLHVFEVDLRRLWPGSVSSWREGLAVPVADFAPVISSSKASLMDCVPQGSSPTARRSSIGSALCPI